MVYPQLNYSYGREIGVWWKPGREILIFSEVTPSEVTLQKHLTSSLALAIDVPSLVEESVMINECTGRLCAGIRVGM